MELPFRWASFVNLTRSSLLLLLLFGFACSLARPCFAWGRLKDGQRANENKDRVLSFRGTTQATNFLQIRCDVTLLWGRQLAPESQARPPDRDEASFQFKLARAGRVIDKIRPPPLPPPQRWPQPGRPESLRPEGAPTKPELCGRPPGWVTAQNGGPI